MHLHALQREHETKLMNRMKNSSKADFQTKGSSWRSSKYAGFLKPTGYKPLFVLFWLFLIQQYSGIYITLFYSVTFFQVSLNYNSEILCPLFAFSFPFGRKT